MRSRWKGTARALAMVAVLGAAASQAQPPPQRDVVPAETPPPLGLPRLQVPEDNPMTPAKIALGEKLFKDKRFSSTGQVACANCHKPEAAFTDGPLKVSKGIDDLEGTRNAPTVLNAAYNRLQFWDGRSPKLEDQALHPFLNPVEMNLKDHDALLAIIRGDRDYVRAFRNVFDKTADEIDINDVTFAIAAFERTQVSGNSPFDRWYFGKQENAIDDTAKRGFKVFLEQGRCVSCHTIEQDHAIFTDHLFHNIGVGINDIEGRVPELARAFQVAKARGADVDVEVLTDPDVSHLGRFAVTNEFSMIGAFKTPTLRNIAVTAPYMHDGSLLTLREVVEHYNNGGVRPKGANVNAYIAGGIRPLELSEQQIDELVAFMQTLTSPEVQAAVDGASPTSASTQGASR